MTISIIIDSVSGNDARLSYTIKLLIFCQAYLALDRQPPMAEAAINSSVIVHDIGLPWAIKLLIFHQAHLALDSVRNHNSVGMKRPYLHKLSIEHLHYGVA